MMIGILSRRIGTICDEDLKWFREQVFAVADQDALAEGVDGVGAATAMQQKPSVITKGLSVEVIIHGLRGPVPARQRFPGRGLLGGAHAWADAIARVLWTTAEFSGSQEAPGGKYFHYVLKDFEVPPSVEVTAVVL